MSELSLSAERKRQFPAYILLILVLFIIGTAFVGYTAIVSEKHSAIVDEHAMTTSLVVQKGRLLKRLQDTTGFGGLIHNFKNYILRRNDAYFASASKDFERFNQVLAEYRQLPLTESERSALTVISNTLSLYHNNLQQAKELIESGREISFVDRAIEVSDKEMIGALVNLEHAWVELITANNAKSAHSLASTKQIGTAIRLAILALLIFGGAVFWYMVRLDRERQALIQKLSESETKFREMIDNSGDAIITITEKGIIESSNKRTAALFGYSSNEILGQNVSVLLPAQDRHQLDEYLQNSTKVEEQVFSQPRGLKGTHKNGTLIPIEWNIAPYWTGNEKHFIGIIRDISERVLAVAALNKAKLQAEDASATKSRFLANASHELRTPLNAIIGFSSMIAMDTEDNFGPKKYREYADDINGAAMHLLSIINDLLDLSRIEQGELDIKYRSVTVTSLIDHAVDLVVLDAQKKNISISKSQTDEPTTIECDALRITQVLVNVLANAVKFSPATSDIQLESRAAPDDKLEIVIRDSGIGIPSEKLQVIFSPFVQHHNVESLPEVGTGLGLAISKHLVELHGGSISIMSEEGTGTTVTILIPQMESGKTVH